MIDPPKNTILEKSTTPVQLEKNFTNKFYNRKNLVVTTHMTVQMPWLYKWQCRRSLIAAMAG
jgi:hypothetical protein